MKHDVVALSIIVKNYSCYSIPANYPTYCKASALAKLSIMSSATIGVHYSE